jgi:uncharacterized protein (DUF1800 family)
MTIMRNLFDALDARRFGEAIAFLLALLFFYQSAFVVSAVQGSHRKKAFPRMSQNQQLLHVLSRVTFGARPGDFERVKAMGVGAFIGHQLDPDSIEDSALQAKLSKLTTLDLATPTLIAQYTPPKPAPTPTSTPTKTDEKGIVSQQAIGQDPVPPTVTNSGTALKTSTPSANGSMDASEAMAKTVDNALKPNAWQTSTAKPKPTPPSKNPQMVVTELQRAALLRAVYSERQLYEQMVDFWENHFSIFANKDDDRYLLTGFDREAIRPFAMGRLRDLLGATAHSPAMLYYLDNWRSSVPRPYSATKDKAAGIDGGLNENYARELMELHTMGVDGGYTQKDVEEVARCFTGWTIQKPNEEGLFVYRPGLHDKGEKIVLGHKILAGGGMADGERVLDILATHPATAHFVAMKLARRFISDDPPQSVIDRAAEVFLKTDGSIRETLRAIITSPEFFSPAAYRAKIRSPFEYVVAAMRALNADTNVDPAVPDWTKRMGQPVFGRITPDGYPDRSEQWLSAGTMLARLNFASALATNGIKGTHIDPTHLLGDADMNNPLVVSDRLTSLILTDEVSQVTRDALRNIASKESAQAGAPSSAWQGVAYGGSPATPTTASTSLPPYVAQLITLAIGSPEFQRR